MAPRAAIGLAEASLPGGRHQLRRAQLIHELLGDISAEDLAGLLPETDKQIEELHALLEFPADEIAEQLAVEAEEAYYRRLAPERGR